MWQKARLHLEVTKVAAKGLKPHKKRRPTGKEGLLFVFFLRVPTVCGHTPFEQQNNSCQDISSVSVLEHVSSVLAVLAVAAVLVVSAC